MTKGRTEAFSDGVFAVAATVLLFSIGAFATGLALWPLATLTALVDVGVALSLFAFVVLFYLVLPILREDSRAALSGERGAPRLAHEDATATETHRGDLGKDP